MALIRLVNSTTSLLVDDTLEDGFFRIIDPAFRAAIEKKAGGPYVDVQLVGRHDMPPVHTENRIPDMDTLGFYVSHDPATHYPVIKVCPERVLDACRSWNKKINGSLPVAERYAVLLHAVIIHELAHFLMDERAFFNECCRAPAWMMYLRSLNEDAEETKNSEFSNGLVPDSEREKWLQTKLKSQAHICNIKNQSINQWVQKHPAINSERRKQQEIVEESLANAFVLNQVFEETQLDALRVFVDVQSPPYQAGLRWQSDIHQLLGTASSWSGFKRYDIGVGGRKWVAAPSGEKKMLEDLTQRLLTPWEAIGSFDFHWPAGWRFKRTEREK